MSTPNFPPASLLRRLAAMVYDCLLIMSLSMLYGGIFLAVKYNLLQIELAAGERASIGLAGFIGLILVIGAFYCYFWCHGGQTLGMKAWRMRLFSNAGNRVSLRQALLRFCTAPLSLACFGLGYFWCLWDAQGKTWHDRFSGTRLLVLPKDKS